MWLLDFFFPKKCFGCGKRGRYICDKCFLELERPVPKCPACDRYSENGFIHQNCKEKLAFANLFCFFRYTGAVRKAILAMKYRFSYDIAGELAERVCRKLKTGNFFVDETPLLVPVPIYGLRKNWRGFNQSEKIGKLVAESMGWRFIPDLLVKSINTSSQTKLGKKERQKNIKGSFDFNSKYSAEKMTDCQIIIFDDVFTTGATMNEVAGVLKSRGFNKVWGMAVAR
jgi:ComF family protein